MRLRLAVLALGVAAAAAPPSAQASFHHMKVVEVFPGTAAAPTGQYVVLQMWEAGQNFVAGHHLHFYDANDVQVLDFTIPGSVGNGASQAKILFATDAAEAFFKPTSAAFRDFTLPGTPIHIEGGKVCFDAIPVDCVAWGNYGGPSTGVGTLFRAPIGLASGAAIHRKLYLTGDPGTLDEFDDTDDSAFDFFQGAPTPANNGGVLGTIPGASCGNGALEGLEECDDGNTDTDDTCESNCTLGLLYADGLESGNFSRWGATSTGLGGQLSVTAGAAITGAFGAAGNVSGTTPLFMEDLTPGAEDRYRARFRFDPTGFDTGEAQNHHRLRLFLGFKENPQRRLFAVVLRRQGGQFSILARNRNDDGSQTDTQAHPITAAVHSIEIDWVRSGDALPTGQLRLWIDGTLVETLASLANGSGAVDFVRLGALNIKPGASGTLRFDDFDSRTTTYIGP